MSDNTNLQSVFQKIIDLRKLSQSSNANEAAAAARLADKLISQYRISELDLESADSSKKEAPLEDDRALYEAGRIPAWKTSLADVLVNHYGCTIWNEKSHRNSRYRLVGRRSDIEIVRYMFAWLMVETERLCKACCKGKGHIACNSYCHGVVAGIAEQFTAATQELKQTQSANLIKLDQRLIDAENTLQMLRPNLRTSKDYSKSYRNAQAYNNGIQAGKKIHLGKSLGNNTKLLGS